jgi:hypothetical protein
LSYRLFKSDFRFEKYLDVLNDKNRFTFCRFRTSNHRLPIEVTWEKRKVQGLIIMPYKTIIRRKHGMYQR